MLIVTDLDNTLLRSDRTVSDYTARVFAQLRKRGHRIAFATARGAAADRFVQRIKPDILISNGGASISVDGKLIYQNMLSKEDVQRVIELCSSLTEGCALISIENDDGYYCNFVPADPDRRAVFTYTDFKNFCAPAYKVSPELENDVWAEDIAKACKNCSLLNFTGEKWRRFAAKNANKETALKFLVKYLGMDMGDVIAFGDDINDLGMLQLAGTAVCVDNAIAEVKEICDHITLANDADGVAHWLEEKLLA